MTHQVAQATGAFVSSACRLDAQLLALTRLRAVLLHGTVDLILAQGTIVLPVADVFLVHADSADEMNV